MTYTWILILTGFSFFIGLVAPVAGIGGGVLFVPLAAAFFPFNIDFIRGTGLILALTSSLTSTPYLVQKGLANLKIMIPLVVVSNITAIIGSVAGLRITNVIQSGESWIIIFLGLILVMIFLFMILSKRVEFPEVDKADLLSQSLGLEGSWYEPSRNEVINYKTTNFIYGLILFAGVGLIAGMFGLGAGWASVPVLNLVMGAPIKIAVATSMAIITVNTSSASWIYISRGAILPIICVPSVTGMSLGAWLGAKIAAVARPIFIKYLVMGIMLFAGVIDIIKGLKGLGII
ncbi:MAG: sulfite exporter TauE/SafE family protein [Spirochaetes bacterium]|nr:MAG: sulfite exporter TauE/SafE family protein [Spirochaetota bacterium]